MLGDPGTGALRLPRSPLRLPVYYSAIPAVGHSLTIAKELAANITLDSPLYIQVKR